MKISAVAIAIALLAVPAHAQVQERTIRWGISTTRTIRSASGYRSSPRFLPPRAAES